MLWIRGVCIRYEYMVYVYTWYEYVVHVHRTWILGINIRDVNTWYRNTWYEYEVCEYMMWIYGIGILDMDLMRFVKYMNKVWYLTDDGYDIRVKHTTTIHGKGWLVHAMNMYMGDICTMDMHMWIMWPRCDAWNIWV